eukprot:2556039-Prorocentrum_lima.AAC.1
MTSSLVGSEMCIRDRYYHDYDHNYDHYYDHDYDHHSALYYEHGYDHQKDCLLYTSDAADDM